MTNGLRDSISALAATFATSVVAAIRSSSLEDILDLATDAKSAPRGATPKAAAGHAATSATPAAKAPARRAKRTEEGHLARRSPADIAKVLDRVMALVKSEKGGLRSEQIRERLGLLRTEMPRVLKAGLEKKVLKSKGVKRSTVYSAA